MSRLPGLMAGRRESNPQRTVLETAALPIELLPYMERPEGLEPSAF